MVVAASVDWKLARRFRGELTRSIGLRGLVPPGLKALNLCARLSAGLKPAPPDSKSGASTGCERVLRKLSAHRTDGEQPKLIIVDLEI